MDGRKAKWALFGIPQSGGGHYLGQMQSGHYLELHLQMSYERGFHSQWGGVAAGPVAGRRGERGEGGDVAVDSMVQQVTPGVPHTVGGVRTNLSIRDTWFCLILSMPPLFIAMEASWKMANITSCSFPRGKLV